VRCARFIARKQWVICGADDMTVRVYNYNTGDLLKRFEAHSDYLRSIAVHPTLSLSTLELPLFALSLTDWCRAVLTCSDDMSIKLWDWDKDWTMVRLYEGHTHYLMGLAFNPKVLIHSLFPTRCSSFSSGELLGSEHIRLSVAR